jgi:hypothetical protein
MKRTSIVIPLAILLSTIAGCIWDNGEEWRDGPYALGWANDAYALQIQYELGGGGAITRVDEQVFAVGANAQYIVAKQHPHRDRKVVHFFIIDRAKDNHYLDREAVIGPLEPWEYAAKKKELILPEFDTVIKSLE